MNSAGMNRLQFGISDSSNREGPKIHERKEGTNAFCILHFLLGATGYRANEKASTEIQERRDISP